ncbi:hypothetical protein F2P79_000457 [Pimephales promelas]|nr:hypothetical protein F2P79_000457 [Pimephales promelas]
MVLLAVRKCGYNKFHEKNPWKQKRWRPCLSRPQEDMAKPCPLSSALSLAWEPNAHLFLIQYRRVKVSLITSKPPRATRRTGLMESLKAWHLHCGCFKINTLPEAIKNPSVPAQRQSNIILNLK